MTKSIIRPLISVVIPSYNQFEGLKKTVNSLLGPSEDKWLEIIVSDGGSTDGSAEWLLENVDNIPHIRISPDKGIYDGMNLGVEMARGEWVWFLGTGDTPHGDSLVGLKKDLERNIESSLLAYGVHLLPPREPGVPEYYTPVWGNRLKLRNTLHHQGVIYSRDLIKEHQFNLKYNILADYHLHLVLWMDGVKCQCSRTIISEVDSGGVSRQFTAELYREERALKREAIGGLASYLVQAVATRLKYLGKTVYRVLSK